MSRDGTNRGGRRVRAGDKPTPLKEKIAEGKAARILELPIIEPESDLVGEDLGECEILDGVDMPEPSDYLSAMQRDGKPLGADRIFKETWLWLKARGCESLVYPRLIEQYSQCFARYILCEDAISKYGLLGKHPTTGNAVASPFVSESITFAKQANVLWYEIYDIVKQNCTTNYSVTPFEDSMERLLNARR